MFTWLSSAGYFVAQVVQVEMQKTVVAAQWPDTDLT